jgi:Bacterial Ig-like domain (group 3)/BNR/Asp-box repeat
MMGRARTIVVVLACIGWGLLAMPAQALAAAQPPERPAAAQPATKSSPPDRTVFRGQLKQAPVGPTLSAAGVFTIDATSSASSFGGNEPSIAVNPANPDQIAITRFASTWNGNADVLYSTDGGITWTEQTSIPPPPGVAGTSGGPFDQTIDYGRNGTLYGTFLTCTPATGGGCSATSVVTGSTTDPTKASSWSWNGNPAQLTSGTRTNVDQPWLLVNRDPTTASQDNVYVAYDDFGAGPDARVAVSYGAIPVNITADNKAGTASPLATNPGLRLATDPRNGTVYSLYEQSSGSSQPKSVTYKLNRSTDGGANWTLNGDTDGLTVDTVDSDQAPGFKFGGVNALLGGVDHAAVDPVNGDVYVAYGQDVSGGNQIKIRRLTDNGSGGLNVGAAADVSSSTDAALPSVAVLSDGTVGVLYDTYDGNTTAGFPTFSAHLARSTDHGATFSDTVLQTFQSPQQDKTGCTGTDTSCARQRVLGDYQQLKAVGTTFYGAFPGNTSGVPATNPPIDVIFFSVPQATRTSLSSSANPSVFGQPVSFTATVRPVPDGGTVSFSVDGSPLGGAVPVNTTTGQATSSSIATLSVGTHSVNATYSGDANFKPSSAPTLTQTVNKAPVTTTITSSQNPSLWGQAVTFTDTVCPAPPSTSPTAPPTGTVTFGDGSTVLGSATLSPGGGSNCSQAHITWSNLLPGTHTITASYSGDGNYQASDLETFSQTVSCTRTITGKVNRSISASGASTCVVNATVSGSVTSGAGTALFVSNSTIGGSIVSKGGTLFGLCGSTITGAGSTVSVTGATRFVVIGDPGDDGCATNKIGGQVSLRSNSSSAELVGNQIGGTVNLVDTSGTGPFPEDSQAEVEGNTIGGSLHCTGNTPPPTNDGQPNTVAGARTDQCAQL